MISFLTGFNINKYGYISFSTFMGYVGSARQEVGIFHLHWPNDHFHLCFRRAEDY